MYVKVCGLDSVESAAVAVESGADAVGIVMSRTSPRRRSAEEAGKIFGSVAAGVDRVLVVHDMPATDAAEIAGAVGANVLQLHGSYSGDEVRAAGTIFPRIWRATSLADDPELRVGAFGEELLLLDAPKPGSGERWDLSELVRRRPQGRWLLAGGLHPGNVAEAIGEAEPWGVDVSSGVESSPGVKDHARIRAFAESAKRAG
ncbi:MULTISPECIES: phosphoribosylanthranilate isomerase [unclassified Pseudoclavibacter]|uniref:phosphoribosylanthranilate isomerase n=1 Tax=unclassified Pseudoclavibacter TaxID=2615177 RepID=UPI0012F3465F|nr:MULTISPECIES: phosphoribosylanthranilate isomerase [unclassified Pseudoclavibacter]MBF4460344.1 phosphoribosylanthranilate isomerase [Pseudoclavibacter sp. VKM Ac-2867]VXB84717.1 N-(5'-phosphoribosyl)anthranilate isomerase [Pseudoclavibacter sp. 8L]